MNSSVRGAGVCREPRAQVGGEASGSCVASDRRRYTLPTIKRGVEEASMRKRLALILLNCVLCVAATAQPPALTVGTARAVTGPTVTGLIEASPGSDLGPSSSARIIRG